MTVAGPAAGDLVPPTALLAETAGNPNYRLLHPTAR